MQKIHHQDNKTPKKNYYVNKLHNNFSTVFYQPDDDLLRMSRNTSY